MTPEHKEFESIRRGRMSTSTDTLDLQYHTEVKILGVIFTSYIEQ